MMKQGYYNCQIIHNPSGIFATIHLSILYEMTDVSPNVSSPGGAHMTLTMSGVDTESYGKVVLHAFGNY
jgi:hypothetical protein